MQESRNNLSFFQLHQISLRNYVIFHQNHFYVVNLIHQSNCPFLIPPKHGVAKLLLKHQFILFHQNLWTNVQSSQQQTPSQQDNSPLPIQGQEQ